MTYLSPKELLLLPIRWKKVAVGRWEAQVDQHACVLTMNDFPDEPLFTVAIDGQHLDIDDPPKTWTIETING
jgi:hypothetical protein